MYHFHLISLSINEDKVNVVFIFYISVNNENELLTVSVSAVMNGEKHLRQAC